MEGEQKQGEESERESKQASVGRGRFAAPARQNCKNNRITCASKVVATETKHQSCFNVNKMITYYMTRGWKSLERHIIQSASHTCWSNEHASAFQWKRILKDWPFSEGLARATRAGGNPKARGNFTMAAIKKKFSGIKVVSVSLQLSASTQA